MTTMAGKEEVVKLGSYPVLMQLKFGFGFIGFILPLQSMPEPDSKKQVNEITDIMSEARGEEFDFVPTEMLDEVMELVMEIVVDIPKPCRFDSVVLLRMPEHRRNYCIWNNETEKWEKKPYNPNHPLVFGKKVLLIVLDPEYQRVAVA